MGEFVLPTVFVENDKTTYFPDELSVRVVIRKNGTPLWITVSFEHNGRTASLSASVEDSKDTEAFARKANMLLISQDMNFGALCGDMGDEIKAQAEAILWPAEAMRGAIVGAPADPEAFG